MNVSHVLKKSGLWLWESGELHRMAEVVGISDSSAGAARWARSMLHFPGWRLVRPGLFINKAHSAGRGSR
ncbi:hypothetical protein J6590_013985 [Homalodisca vitripennis]|nr:hypothetical protein J6590_013985 [Homalodisca vitripennis]